VGSVLALAALVAIAVLVRRSRRRSPRLGSNQTRSQRLVRGERRRPIAITLLDGLIALILIGPTVGRVVPTSGSTELLALLGGVGGVGVGLLRARTMYVGRVGRTRDVILRRSPLEYGLLVVLLVARSIENTARTSTSSWALPAFSGLITFALVESLARAAFIGERFLRGPALADSYGEAEVPRPEAE
jgi:hypothetical protein